MGTQLMKHFNEFLCTLTCKGNSYLVGALSTTAAFSFFLHSTYKKSAALRKPCPLYELLYSICVEGITNAGQLLVFCNFHHSICSWMLGDLFRHLEDCRLCCIRVIFILN
ncbi:hypothetical protein XELAEV_18029977mg [Xenopus laevis]|uniref:Uncharacterized protein n=1 Tax=Xenopus laevis TaxID=8355 RepID=A0A974HI37_XENLA|nr:hypothetical protein XELAEV_18029977mg [Xenopus laevis]